MMKRRTYTLWHKYLRLNNMVNSSSTIFSFHHPNSTIQQLNNKLTMNTFDNKHIQIIDFLASHHYQPTAKKGANWWYLSPLHDEKQHHSRLTSIKMFGTISDWVKVVELKP